MLKKSHGPCVSKERCVEILTEEIQDLLPEEKWKDYERSVNRVMYEFDKLDGGIFCRKKNGRITKDQ